MVQGCVRPGCHQVPRVHKALGSHRSRRPPSRAAVPGGGILSVRLTKTPREGAQRTCLATPDRRLELRGDTVLRSWPTLGPSGLPTAMDDTLMQPRVRQRNARQRGHKARAPTPRAPLGRPCHHERRAGAVSASFAPAHRQEKETTALSLVHFARPLTNSKIPEGLGGHREPSHTQTVPGETLLPSPEEELVGRAARKEERMGGG